MSSVSAAGTDTRSWEVPTYFFTSGLAGASSVLSTSARLTGNEKLARTSLYIGAVADLVSPALLISDQGRREHFLHRFRVVASGLPLGRRLKLVKLLAEAVATLSGPLLATYTGVLVADTTIPVWHEARHELPCIFGASAAASAGAAACLFLEPKEAGPARRLAVAGVLVEGMLMQAMELRLGKIGEVYRQGEAGKLSLAAKGLATAGAALLARRGKKSRSALMLGGALVCAGELCVRWTVFKAGFQSARDPKYVVEPQRSRVDERVSG